MLEDINMDSKDLRIVRNIYWQQEAAMKVDNITGKYTQIKQGVRQGCVLSPDLFSLYSENILRSIQNMPGIKIGGHNINNLRYADDTVLMAENQEHLQDLLNRTVIESEQKGLSLNIKKTETMIISRNSIPLNSKIVLNEKSLRQVNSFKYLGTLITSDGKMQDRYYKQNRTSKSSNP